MTEEASPVSASRHELFEAARRSAHWTLQQLWIDYVALGGTVVIFDLDAYLCGLMPMPPEQQDVLACALNERLQDLYEGARVPYLTVSPDTHPSEDALQDLWNQLHRPN
jgi:hypothetical protein